MFASRRKEPPPSAHPFNRFWDIALLRYQGVEIVSTAQALQRLTV
jgi:hypothetical protein